MTTPGATTSATGTPSTGPAAPVHARVAGWPLLLLAAPAFVAIWSGWVGLGDLTGFGVVHPLPGIADDFTLNTAITLPIGVETYAAFALRVWLSGTAPEPARRFARWSALGSLALGAAGQIAYHLMTAAGITSAPWQITAAVACLPVVVLGMGAALAHLVTNAERDDVTPAVHDHAPVTHDEVTAVRTPVEPAPRTAPPRTVSAPVPRRQSSAGGPGTDTGVRVARLRAEHPDLTAVQIARRLGVTDRTVRRHLAALAGRPAPLDRRTSSPHVEAPDETPGLDPAGEPAGVAA